MHLCMGITGARGMEALANGLFETDSMAVASFLDSIKEIASDPMARQ